MTATASPVPRASAAGGFLAPVLLLALIWAVHIADALLPGSFLVWGLRSWDPDSLAGLVLGPLLHASWTHLISNSLPLLVMGWLVAVEGAGRFWLVTAVAALIGGIGTWLLSAPGTLTVGASVLVFGYFGYVVVRAFLPGRMRRRIVYAGAAVVVIVLYGSAVLTGIFGAGSGVSWQGHLCGGLGGVVAALAAGQRPVRRRSQGSDRGRLPAGWS